MTSLSASTLGPGPEDSSVDLLTAAGAMVGGEGVDEKQVDEWIMELLDAAVGGICGPLKVG